VTSDPERDGTVAALLSPGYTFRLRNREDVLSQPHVTVFRYVAPQGEIVEAPGTVESGRPAPSPDREAQQAQPPRRVLQPRASRSPRRLRQTCPQELLMEARARQPRGRRSLTAVAALNASLGRLQEKWQNRTNVGRTKQTSCRTLGSSWQQMTAR